MFATWRMTSPSNLNGSHELRAPFSYQITRITIQLCTIWNSCPFECENSKKLIVNYIAIAIHRWRRFILGSRNITTNSVSSNRWLIPSSICISFSEWVYWRTKERHIRQSCARSFNFCKNQISHSTSAPPRLYTLHSHFKCIECSNAHCVFKKSIFVFIIHTLAKKEPKLFPVQDNE